MARYTDSLRSVCLCYNWMSEMSVCKKNLAVYVFVADLQASVYVRDISSVKCIRDTCV